MPVYASDAYKHTYRNMHSMCLKNLTGLPQRNLQREDIMFCFIHQGVSRLLRQIWQVPAATAKLGQVVVKVAETVNPQQLGRGLAGPGCGCGTTGPVRGIEPGRCRPGQYLGSETPGRSVDGGLMVVVTDGSWWFKMV